MAIQDSRVHAYQLPKKGVDSHAHLDLKNFGPDLPEVIQRAEQAGIELIGNVFLGPDKYFQNRDLFINFPGIFFLLGIHPHDAQKANHDYLNKIKTAFSEDNNKRIKALGEIGLDYYWNRSPQKVQRQIFQSQLRLAKENDWPVVIHSREAERETIKILLDLGFRNRPLLWHCFSGDKQLAKELITYGWMLSIPGIVTFNQAKKLQQAVKQIPLNVFTLETDCPFLAPEPYRGKRNEPAYIVSAAVKIAEIKDVEPRQIWTKTGQNAKDFFGLKN